MLHEVSIRLASRGSLLRLTPSECSSLYSTRHFAGARNSESSGIILTSRLREGAAKGNHIFAENVRMVYEATFVTGV